MFEAVSVTPPVPPSSAPAPRPRTSAFARPGEGPSGLISLCSIAALFLLWWGVTAAGLIKPLFLPSPQAVWQQFLEYATGRANDQPLLSHLGASLGRVSAAFVLACLTAIPVGLAMGSSRWVRGLLDPPLEFYRPLPPLAYLPLIIIWCGINELPKVLLIYLSCFAPLALAARSGVRAATTEQMLAAASLGAIVGRSCAMWCGLLRCQKSWSACALPLGLVGPHWWLLRW